MKSRGWPILYGQEGFLEVRARSVFPCVRVLKFEGGEMSWTNEPSGLTRRSFLKSTAVVAGGLWAGTALGCAPSKQAEDGSDAATQQVNEEHYNVCCRPNCFNTCMMTATVRDGKLVKTAPADFPNKEFNRICLRGLVSNENIYHPDRVLYPMKQTGERGSDKWERVSWDDAINDIATKIKGYRKDFGDSSIFKTSGSSVYHATSGTPGKLFGTINACTMSGPLDAGNMYGIMRVFGYGGAPWPGNDQRDYVNAKNLFLWCNNLTDAQIQDWHFVADAIEAGTNVICIDPIYTQMAAKSHKWVPIRPGADLQLIMSMMYVMLDEDLMDWDFVKEHTVAPFLVKDADGLFLRMSDLGVEPTEGPVDPTTGKPTVVDPYAVWDEAAGAAAELSTVAAPALEGAFDVEGTPVHTAFSLLKDEIMKYAPAQASQMCDVPEDVIVELAHLACDGPVTHRVGWGTQAYDNGLAPHVAGATMAALAGQLGKPGANYSSAVWMSWAGGNKAATTPEQPATSPTIAYMNMPEVFESGQYLGEDIKPKALWVYSGNPLCTWCDTNTLRDDIFAKFELVVTVDYMMTDTARYSDYVLPCAHWFEYEDAITSGNTFHIIHSEKAIEPLGEALCDLDIMRKLAAALELPDDLFPESNEAFLREYFDSELAEKQGITYDALCEKNAIHAWGDHFMQWQDLKFATPSGRAEFYVEKPTAYGVVSGKTPDLSREHLPTWFEPREAWPTNPLHEQYPFVLMSERPRFRVHGQWAYNRILRELDPEPTVKINPADADEAGLADGTLVECYNDHGHAVAKLVLNEAIRPGTLVYPKSWQSDQHVAGGWSEPLSRETDAVLVNQSFMDCLVGIRAWKGAE